MTEDVVFFFTPVEGDEDLGGQEPLSRLPYTRAAVQLDDDWIALYRLTPQEGEFVVGEVRIFPGTLNHFTGPEPDEETWSKPLPRGGFTTRALRKIRLGEHVKEAHRQAVQDDRVLEAMPEAFQQFTWDLNPEKRQPGRRRQRDELFYARVAADYVSAIQEGSRKPVADVAAARQYSTSHIRDAVFKARELGLLTSAPPGRPGGRLTDKACKLLERAANQQAQDRIIKARKP